MGHLRGIQLIERGLDGQLTDARATNAELKTAKEQLANQVTKLETALRLARHTITLRNETICHLRDTNNNLKDNTGTKN